MSVIWDAPEGSVVCHEKYLQNLYRFSLKEDEFVKFSPHEHLFLVKTPFMKDAEARGKVRGDSHSLPSKRKFHQLSSSCVTDPKVTHIQSVYQQLIDRARNVGLLSIKSSTDDIIDNNKCARDLSEKLYKESTNWIRAPFSGANNTDQVVVRSLGSQPFIFPPFCKFFCRDVKEIQESVESLGQFDLILLDPPWWNKYIRRKKAKCLQEGYKMMYNDCLGNIPLDALLAPGGIIAVWCTNSKNHMDELREKLFPAWGAKAIAQWTWLKVTKSGLPICTFCEPPGKQPFEQLVFGIRADEEMLYSRPPDGKIFLSVPSAIHSHKPPISELMKPFLPSEPRCLEIFARYLLPKWTSWGLEVLKLQHLSLFHQHQLEN